jgi:hypothetical protein
MTTTHRYPERLTNQGGGLSNGRPVLEQNMTTGHSFYGRHHIQNAISAPAADVVPLCHTDRRKVFYTGYEGRRRIGYVQIVTNRCAVSVHWQRRLPSSGGECARHQTSWVRVDSTGDVEHSDDHGGQFATARLRLNSQLGGELTARVRMWRRVWQFFSHWLAIRCSIDRARRRENDPVHVSRNHCVKQCDRSAGVHAKVPKRLSE